MTTVATPYLEINLPAMQRNLRKLAGYVTAHGLKVRPHTKTHKSLYIAAQQLELGAGGLTVAKAGEAQVMQCAGNDILVAYPALDPARSSLIAELALRNTIHVAVDSIHAADAIAAAAKAHGSTIGILVDLDVGMHRTGLQTPAAALALAQHVASNNHLRLDGLFCYPGHVLAPADQQAAPLGLVSALLRETLDLWQAAGLGAKIVSGGSTPTAYQSHLIPELTEIRPGTYVFNDMNTVKGGYCSLDECAARLICTVVSNAVPGKVIIDAGSKTLTSDRNALLPDSGHGHVVEYPQARIARLSEEHGELDISQCDQRPSLGERVSVIPNHICPCVNLQDRMFLRGEDGSIEPLPVDARGRLS